MFWALMSRRLRTAAALTVAAPVAGWVLGKAGERLEARGGPTALTRTMRRGEDLAYRYGRGPLARTRRRRYDDRDDRRRYEEHDRS